LAAFSSFAYCDCLVLAWAERLRCLRVVAVLPLCEIEFESSSTPEEQLEVLFGCEMGVTAFSFLGLIIDLPSLRTLSGVPWGGRIWLND